MKNSFSDTNKSHCALRKLKIQIRQVSRAVKHPVQLAHVIVIDINLFFVKNIQRRHLISLSYSFSCRFSILVELELVEMLVFCGGRKTGEPGEKPSEQDESQNKKLNRVEN